MDTWLLHIPSFRSGNEPAPTLPKVMSKHESMRSLATENTSAKLTLQDASQSWVYSISMAQLLIA
jgi:hypothetical protein